MLPKRSGFLVLKRIRELLKDRDTSVIMITANQGTRHRIHAEGMGVEGYLYKPFRMEDLTGLLSSCLFGEKSDNHISR